MSAFRDLKRLVVKVGSTTVTGQDGRIDREFVSSLVLQLAKIRRGGVDVTLVTSGAIAAGVERLGMSGRPRSVPVSQAAAAVGQALLMQFYQQASQQVGQTVAQVLLTRQDMADRSQYVNVTNTFDRLFGLGVIPIVNENDTVAVDEIKFGDNDRLSAMVAALIGAELLVLLSDVPGLIAGSTVIPLVTEITADIERIAGGAGSELGTGGMASKIEAAKIARNCGVCMVVAAGRETDIVPRVMAGEDVGTFFAAKRSKLNRRKRWIAFGQVPRGRLVVNAGAADAVAHKRKSLLPAGIVDVDGSFGRHDLVRICTEDGTEVARGLSSYRSEHVRGIMGRRSDEIPALIGVAHGDEVVHRDNLVVGV